MTNGPAIPMPSAARSFVRRGFSPIVHVRSKGWHQATACGQQIDIFGVKAWRVTELSATDRLCHDCTRALNRRG